jgi:hypothetical protein
MARDAPAELVPLFHAAMAREEARPRLDAFVKSLSAGEADACIGAYFAASSDPAYHYSRTDKKSLGVFAALAFVAVDRGEPLYAVRFDALVHAETTLWRERFTALDPGQQGRLATRAKQLQKALSRPQREILRMLPEAVRTGRTGEMEQYVDRKLDFREAHGCLLAYLEASLRHPADNQRSLQVFAGLSILTIRKGDADFVQQYRRLVGTAGTTWSLRWGALEQYYRDKVNEELASRPLEVKLIEVGKTPGTMPISVVTPSPGRLRADATRRDAAKPTEISRKLVALFDAYMTPGGDHRAKKVALTEFIFAQKLPGARECLAAYLEASTRYPADSEPSLYIFWGTASRLINLGKAYEALKLDQLRKTPGTLVAQRFAALPETWRTRLEGEIATLTATRTRRILDDVKLEYWKRNRADADLAALRAFEADVDASHRDAVRGAARACDRTYRQRDAKAFADAFDAWTDLMHAQTDPLVLVTMLKWCRELVEITPALRSELYWYGVLGLQVAGLVRYPEVYDRGLSQEEKDFFLHPSLVPQGYRFDFERRLELAWWKRASKTQLRDVSRAHALLLYLAQKLGFTLVAMDGAEKIREKLLQLKAEKSKDFDDIRIPVSSRFPADSLTLGATVGNLYIVWWERKTSQAYVEMDGFGRVLFAVDSYLKLGQLKREDATYGQIWRDTQHLLVVIPFFFQVMGYLPDLVTGGFAGLVNSVVTDMMVDVFAEQAGLGEKGTMALSFAAALVSGHMLDRMRESDGTRVLLDLDDVEELYEGLRRGTTQQADIPVAPRERATGGDAKGLDMGGGGGGGPKVLDEVGDLETHGAPGARADEAPHKTRAQDGDEPRGEEAHGDAEDLEEPRPAAGGESGAFSERDEGSGKASKQGADPEKYNRLQGDDRAQPTAGSTDARATRDKGVRSKGGRGGDGGKPDRTPPYDLIVDESHPLIEDLQREGWTFQKIPVKQPKSLGGAFQRSVGGDFEWRITSPSGEHFDADFLANNPSGSGILIGDAKATRVTDPSDSGHLVFWSDKAEALGRATALSLESDGRMTVEIVCNVNEIAGTTGKSFVGPEVYTNVVNQQVAVDLLERRGAALDRYYAERGKPGYKPTRDEVQRLVDRRVEVSDWDWGKIGKEPPPPKGGPRGTGPKRR